MKKFNKIKLATAFGSVVLATALSVPANAAIVLGGDNGWEVSYGGFVNLFYTQSDFEFSPGANCFSPTNCQEDSAHLQEGLLPAFHTFTVKSPEINGLKGTGQITFAPDSSLNKTGRLNKAGLFGSGPSIDMREVFFSVSGDFGTITAGRTLSLFQRQAILKDYTLFGMGALAGPDGSGTGLGRIGFGYVYPDFRTQFKYTTPDINGFVLDIAIFDPQEPIGVGNISETDTPQFQAEANYNTAFDGGSFGVWVGFLWQEQEITVGTTTTESTSFGYNIGVDINFGGFNFMGSYYDGEALGSVLFNLGGAGDAACAASCVESDSDGYIIQGAYTFNGTTKLGISYGESNDQTPGAVKTTNQLWTVGVYHDVNSWLKVIAEYGSYESDFFGFEDVDTFSIGGFLLW
ncbi:MAG: porin [Proteobacteria bacterium]|nr:porin [Pseudomonadota bacterium]